MTKYTTYIKFALGLLLFGLFAGNPVSAQDDQAVVEISAPSINQGVLIKGKITFDRNGQPIEGVAVSFGQFTSTFTNSEGAFELLVPSLKSTIQLRWDDNVIREVPIRGQQQLAIRLTDGDLTKTGYTVQLPYRRIFGNHNTEATSTVNLRDSWTMNAVSPETALQGGAAGVNMIRRSGTLAMGANTFIRGLSSLNSNTQPLVVVDGMIYDMNEYDNSIIDGYFSNPLSLIDIKDVSDVTFIKDGSSIYGTKAANGVILITTSRAESLTTKIDFHTYGGVNMSPRRLPVMDAGEYRPYFSQMLLSSGLTPGEALLHPYMNERQDTLGYFNYQNDTDWQNLVMNSSFDQNYYIKVSGGDNIASYALSLGHIDSKGVIGNDIFSRSSVRFNGDFKITEKLSAGTNMSFAYAIANQYMYGGGTQIVSPIHTALTKSPFLAPNLISADGIISPNISDVDEFGKTNPMAIINNMQGENRRFRFFGSFNAKYEFNENLNITSLYGLTLDQVRESFFVPNLGVEEIVTPNALITNRMGGQVQRLTSNYSDTRLNYDKIFNYNHNLNVGLGFRYQSNNIEEDRGLAFNSGTDDLITLESGILNLNRASGAAGDWAWMSYYANVNYNYMSKYFLNAVVAVDGSSRIGKEAQEGISLFGHKFGVFPSVSGAWLISSEEFMSNSALDLLKLRASFGITGNDGIGNYGSFQLYGGSNLLGMQGLVRSNLANPEIQWETNQKTNIGVDIATFNQKLSFSLDFYQNNISNMLTFQPLNAATGLDFYLINSGAMNNKGIDFAINSRVWDRELKLDLGLTLGRYINEVTALPYNQRLTPVGKGEVITTQGQAAAMFYGYKTNGVFSTSSEASASGLQTRAADGTLMPFRAGDVRFVDLNGDGIIDANDKQIIGNPNPDFFGMFSLNAAYKRFTFDAAFTFSVGNDIYNYQRHQLESMTNFDNQLISVNNRWRNEGQITDMPRLSFGDPYGNSRFSDRWIEDGSYLRLKAVNITYNIPIDGRMVKNLTIYGSGQNLFTLTNYLGYDPEFSATRSVFGQGVDYGLMPTFSSVLLGLKIGL
ncbi:SusC/RagA family TonB-linked outer membrane protein [Belliella sp. R4-6]|uniref:SusC/RagA family TonB-linked outer membrane protein n=1 Tax=Belliella alkalica TaxID=1730871 RepID=A0ABS9VDM9_9BACT|nr:SusC/RagA family TonB-linked outer membrane protein [Belliella alkalica]MCH7414532.1 SusC/RagA family TonB-linked outer membrane protein [Belliella alkalica]